MQQPIAVPEMGPQDDEDESESPGMDHVYPVFGRAHVVRFDCWCHPVLDWGDGCPIVVHTVHH